MLRLHVIKVIRKNFSLTINKSSIYLNVFKLGKCYFYVAWDCTIKPIFSLLICIGSICFTFLRSNLLKLKTYGHIFINTYIMNFQPSISHNEFDWIIGDFMTNSHPPIAYKLQATAYKSSGFCYLCIYNLGCFTCLYA